VNWHNVWGAENLHVTLEHERDSSKVNVFCAISKEKVYGPFFFMKNNFIFQQDGTPPHFHIIVQKHLNTHLTRR
jgi:hypothetical protein